MGDNMPNTPEWLFDESHTAGVDYADPAVAEDYDTQHEGFRNFEQEARRMGEALGLSGESLVLDMGCGTGGLSLHLAGMCKHVYAVDASAAMLDRLKRKIAKSGARNITPVNAGFLTYEHDGPDLDAVISTVALHHLPDFWKQIALCRINGMLKPGGKLFLLDVVFSFAPKEHAEAIDGWLDAMRAMAGDEIAEESLIHVGDEFSTWSWIMEGMLEEAGFVIDSTTEVTPNVSAYVCSKRQV